MLRVAEYKKGAFNKPSFYDTLPEQDLNVILDDVNRAVQRGEDLIPDWLTAYAGSGTQGRLVFSQSMTSFGKGLYAGDDDVSVTW